MTMQRIRAALAPLGIPVDAVGDARKPVYAVVHEMLEQPELRADDAEALTGHYAQVDFIGKKDLTGLVKQATKLLTDAGFVRRGAQSEYEPASQTFRFSLRVFLLTEYEEE